MDCCASAVGHEEIGGELMVTTWPHSAAVENGEWDPGLSVSRINGGIVIQTRPANTVHVGAQPLTDREGEVLALVAEGLTNKLIGAQLGISERTVKNHLTSIMTKLRATDRTHSVVTAVRLGWLAI
jgi:DNA-binding NarL/FixJ family response regulator